MNTFLPFADFNKSAKCLDRQRLGKQRVECIQLLNVMLGKKVIKSVERGPVVIDFEPKGWVHHPCIGMWDSTINAFGIYTLVMCREWQDRGYLDTVHYDVELLIPHIDINWTVKFPKWLGDPDFHRSHQSNLIRKDANHYGPLFPGVPNDLPYVWPVGS